ncbi:MAG TPA: acyltransferase [Chloroflexota bacterium]|nr:acyltransferase [Chloroflexota bacterium]
MQKSVAQRDDFLDYLRGGAIIWVILVHTFYHKSFFPYTVQKSYLLFEMPVFFFVSGAALYYSHRRNPSVSRFVSRRLVRLLIPYVLLALVCLPLYYVWSRLSGQPMSKSDVISWLTLYPQNTVPQYVGWYMWFVRAMFAVSLAHLVLVRTFFDQRGRWPLVAGLTALVIVIPFAHGADHLGFLQEVAFYSLNLILGYAYAAGMLPRRARDYLAIALVAALALFALVHLGWYTGDLQGDKFPPNLAYGVFGIAALSIFLAFRPWIETWLGRSKIATKVIDYYNVHSYSVYLWQGFGFWAIDGLVALTGLTGWLFRVPYVIPMALYFLGALTLTAPIAYLADKVTDMVQSSAQTYIDNVVGHAGRIWTWSAREALND